MSNQLEQQPPQPPTIHRKVTLEEHLFWALHPETRHLREEGTVPSNGDQATPEQVGFMVQWGRQLFNSFREVLAQHGIDADHLGTRPLDYENQRRGPQEGGEGQSSQTSQNEPDGREEDGDEATPEPGALRQLEADCRRHLAKIKSLRNAANVRHEEFCDLQRTNEELCQINKSLERELARTKKLISPDVAAADEETRNLREQLNKALRSNDLLSYQLTLELAPGRPDDFKARRDAASIKSLTNLLDASRRETEDLRKQLEASDGLARVADSEARRAAASIQSLTNRLDASCQETEDLRQKLEAAEGNVRINDSEASRDSEQRVATATAKAAGILAAATAKAAEIVAAATVKAAQLEDTALLEAEEVVAKARRENRSEAQQRRGKKEMQKLETNLPRELRKRQHK
ncbi:hypothetical protein CAEBREN_21144 [Caenorhabditis brenneri]|uniref:Uncharacterized protein n=1 Tax=Caenorhabditis brenneri TaxID=135651 RepID=G0P3B6_CAEBE|nr:hypothetical protein CAEBREN_21144 [Caenorhabditis brenneri]